MMIDPVIQDLDRYLRELDEREAAVEWIEEETDRLLADIGAGEAGELTRTAQEIALDADAALPVLRAHARVVEALLSRKGELYGAIRRVAQAKAHDNLSALLGGNEED